MNGLRENFLLFVPRADYLKHSPFLPIGYVGTLIHLEWPPQSPDLSPIEQIWDFVKSKMDTLKKLCGKNSKRMECNPKESIKKIYSVIES
jgi:transposase